MQGLQLRRRLRIGVAIAPLVVALEGLPDLDHGVQSGDGHMDVVPLSVVAHLRLALEIDVAGAEVPGKSIRGAGLHLPEAGVHPGRQRVVEDAGEGLRRVDPCVRQEHADGGEVAGFRRDDHRRDGQLARQRGGMQRPAAAVGEQREIARVESVLHRDLADGAGHQHGGDGDDSVSGADQPFLAAVAERRSRLRGDGVARRFEPQGQLAAQEAVGVEPPEHKIRIGDGGLGAPALVAHRPGGRSGALGSDVEPFLAVQPRDGAAARPDLDDVDHRPLDGETLDVAVHVVDRLHGEAPVLHQGAFRRGAAHVEGDDVADAERLGIGAGAYATPDGTGFHQPDGLAASAVHRQQTTVGAHHEQRAVIAL